MHVMWISGIAFGYVCNIHETRTLSNAKMLSILFHAVRVRNGEYNGIKEQKILQQYYVLMYNNGKADYCYHILFGY